MISWLLKLATGNPIVLLYLAGGIFLAGLAAGAAPAWKIQGWRLEAVTARFDQFKAQVTAEGEIAKQKAAEQVAKDKQRAKEADDEAKKRYSSLDAQYAQYRMRQRAGSGATSSLVPSTTASTTSSSAICYTREKLDIEISGAIRRLRAGLADDSEPYDKAALVARTCKEWAARR